MTKTFRTKSGIQTRTYEYGVFNVLLPGRLHERLAERARKEGKTMSQIVRTYITRGLAST